MGQLLLTLLLLLAFAPPSGAQVETKDVTAPPSDLLSGRLRLPEPRASALVSTSALLRLDELREGDLALQPGAGKAGVVLLGPGASRWGLTGAGDGPIASRIEPADALTPGVNARALRLAPFAPNTAVHLEPPSERGADGDGCVVLIADGANDVLLRTWFDGHTREVGKPLALSVELEGAGMRSLGAQLIDPDGRTVDIEAQHGVDAGAVSWTPEIPGLWTVRTIARSVDTLGVPRVRTTQHVVRVTRPLVTPDGVTKIGAEAGRVVVRVPARTLGVEASVLVAAEVWGQDRGGEAVPVCWSARMQRVDGASHRATLALSFDPRWLAEAGVEDMGTLTLRELRVHSASGTSLIAHDPAPRVLAEGTPQDAGPADPKADILRARSGVYVPAHASPRSQRAVGGHVLLLSHGYCSGGIPFEIPHFSSPVKEFNDFGQNRTNDEFALLLEARGRDFKSMGLVGHSQGGNAGAHLYTFYWSALDWATGGRLLQSVGAPYQGTPLAGAAANLGSIFGAGCGQNADLAPDGAALWLSTIPTSTRERVWYWTTSFEDRPFSFDFCEFATDFLLSDPEDGVIERSRGQLPGANNMGHVEGQCHTDGMRDPPQCRDLSRNTEINAEAAR